MFRPFSEDFDFEGTTFQWTVRLPGRSSSSFGAKPRAHILMFTNERGREELSVPKAVGKALDAKARRGSVRPSSRAELIYELRTIETNCLQARFEALLNQRDYSCKELEDKFSLDGYPSDITRDLIGRAQDSGLLSDERFADVFIRSKISCGWGIARISRELSRRGIDTEQLVGWPDAYLDDASEADRAYDAARRKRFYGKDPFAQAVRFLVTRGFSMSVAMDVAYRLKEEETLDAAR